MRQLLIIMVTLAIYGTIFTAIRLTRLYSASAVFDWSLIAVAAVLGVYLNKPLSVPKGMLLFLVTGISAFLLALLITYTILGDSF